MYAGLPRPLRVGLTFFVVLSSWAIFRAVDLDGLQAIYGGMFGLRGVGEVIGLEHYLTLAAMLFVLGIAGIIINRRNLILLLMCIELMLLAVNFNFVAFSRYLDDITGQVFVFFILTVAAAEAAIGLAILVVLFRNRRSIAVQELNTLKG